MSLFSKLKNALSSSSTRLSEGVVGIFTKEKLGPDALAELEELLIMADLGAGAAAEITASFAKERFEKNENPEAIKAALANAIAALLPPPASLFSDTQGLQVIALVGVNGNGKTTTIGKLAANLQGQGKKVMLAAADTFRAAAAEQLEVWARRLNVPLVKGAAQSDPAAVAFEAATRSRAEGVDVLLIDTAGRLQNKSNLMDELKKIIRVLKKVDEAYPTHVVQVLDATTGGNALSQVESFKELVDVSGLIITKLDGTAKGGVVVALAKQFALPVYYIGLGEGVEDLQPFDAQAFSRNLVGV